MKLLEFINNEQVELMKLKIEEIYKKKEGFIEKYRQRSNMLDDLYFKLTPLA